MMPAAPPAARRLGYRVGARLVPELAGRRATNAFGHTRSFGLYPDDVVPLGARRFRIRGNPDIESGYVWRPDGGGDGDGGDGTDAALVVHGWGVDSSTLHGLIPALRQHGLRVAAFDAPAHGVNPGTQATMTQFSRAVGSVLDTLGGARVVVAHSLGSIAAISAVANRPHMAVGGVVLLAPPNSLTGVLERWASGPDQRLPRRVVDRIYAELHGRNGVPVSHWDIAQLGRSLEVPVLVVHDPDDELVPFDEAQTVVAGLPQARLAAVSGVGHFGVLSSAEVRELISGFVVAHPRSPVGRAGGGGR
jgi:pimeloyl-ACP methyl ester carboxylesterase